jgi:hypothetical protein
MFSYLRKIRHLPLYLAIITKICSGCASSSGQDDFEDEFGNNVNNAQFNENFAEFENNQGSDGNFNNFEDNGQFDEEFANDGEFVNSANNPFANEFKNDEFGFDNNENGNLFGSGEFVNNADQNQTKGKSNGSVSVADKNENTDEDILITEEPEPEPVFVPLTAKVDPNAITQYVLPGGSSLHTEPDGASTRSLDQGDHPLIFGDGDWVSTSDGYYIPSQTLSKTPIGRRKQKQSWQ